MLENGDQLFKFFVMFRGLGVYDQPARVSIYDSTVHIVLIENKIYLIFTYKCNNIKHISDFIDRYSKYIFKSLKRRFTYN